MSITVRFTGICTHVRTMGGENTPSSRRIVLVRADHGAFINGQKIPPHVPKLTIDPKDIVQIDGFPHGLEATGQAGVWRLCGVQLALEGCTESYSPEPSSEDIPRLKTDKAPGMSGEVTTQGQAACYFLMTHGRLTSEKTEQGAIYGVLESNTTETPALRVTCFWNQESYLIWLRPGATLEISHTGYQQGDSDMDFLLHYRIFSSVPTDAKVPPEKKTTIKGNSGDIRIGCSNSQYP